MREIKFRAWIKNENVMSNCNSFQSVNFGITGEVESIINVMVGVESRMSNDGEYYPEQYQYLDKFKHDEFELMQYTGLKDKSGVEIYEGDVIKDSDGDTAFVIYKAENNLAEYFLTQDGENGWYFWDSEPIEVIGNIYENPELLKGGKE